AFQLALITSGVIAFLGVLSLSAAFYGGMLKPTFDDWRRSRRPRPDQTDDGAARAGGLLLVAMIGFVLMESSGLHIGLVGLLALYVTILLADHARARGVSRPESSAMSALLAPRVYRGSRRLVLISVAVAIPTVDGYATVGSWVAWTVLLFAIDRMLPVVDRGDDYVPGGGRSKWLWRTTLVAATGVVAVGFLALLQVILDASQIDAKVQQVRAGQRLNSSLLDPLTLAEPRADPVLVRWVAPNPPDPFTRDLPSSLTFLGQNGGTAVFLNTRSSPQAVYRFPASAIAIEAPSGSILG
ncbi:MAG: hypothetical protein M3N04_09885, partial [Actinomycetota bacterium]|nr:hypothetical protein [Actinomycetota bacterium]